MFYLLGLKILTLSQYISVPSGSQSKKWHFRSPQNYNEYFFSSAELSNVGAGNEYPMSEKSKFTVMLYFFMFSFFEL